MQNFEIQIHDIKPLVEIQDYSLYYLIVLIALIIVFAGGIAYIIYKWFHRRGEYNVRKEHLAIMNEVDIHDTKNTAYTMSIYGATFKDDTPRHNEIYKNMRKKLNNYKYKKSVEAFDREVLGYIELYRDMIDV